MYNNKASSINCSSSCCSLLSEISDLISFIIPSNIVILVNTSSRVSSLISSSIFSSITLNISDVSSGIFPVLSNIVSSAFFFLHLLYILTRLVLLIILMGGLYLNR